MNNMKKLFLGLSAVAALTGCTANIDDLVLYTESVRANTPVSVTPYPEFKPLPNVSYSASDLRNPFIRSRTQQIADTGQEQVNCKQPNTSRSKDKLESFGLDGLQMSGVFTTNGRKYGLVTANDGSLHRVTRGSYIGLFNGRVTAVRNNEILIEEMLPDGAGCWKSKQATLTKSSMVGENTNV
jgi:type IV pilus assembly protein PilP